MGYETTISLKEKEEFKECTFKPRINKIDFSYDQNRTTTIDPFTRLYTDHEKYNTKKLMKTLQKDYRDSKINCFSPNLSQSRKMNMSYSLQSRKFFDRLDQVINYLTNSIYKIKLRFVF